MIIKIKKNNKSQIKLQKKIQIFGNKNKPKKKNKNHKINPKIINLRSNKIKNKIKNKKKNKKKINSKIKIKIKHNSLIKIFKTNLNHNNKPINLNQLNKNNHPNSSHLSKNSKQFKHSSSQTIQNF
jgi:hypothetical protein